MIFIWKHDKEKDNPNAVAPTDAAAGNLLDDKLPDKVHHSVSVVAFTCFEHGYTALSKQLKKIITLIACFYANIVYSFSLTRIGVLDHNGLNIIKFYTHDY